MHKCLQIAAWVMVATVSCEAHGHAGRQRGWGVWLRGALSRQRLWFLLVTSLGCQGPSLPSCPPPLWFEQSLQFDHWNTQGILCFHCSSKNKQIVSTTLMLSLWANTKFCLRRVAPYDQRIWKMSNILENIRHFGSYATLIIVIVINPKRG